LRGIKQVTPKNPKNIIAVKLISCGKWANEVVGNIKANIFAHIQNVPLSDDLTMLAVKQLSLDQN